MGRVGGNCLRKVLVIAARCLPFLLLVWIGTARAVETEAGRAMIVELNSSSVLFDKNSSEGFAPGNFTKLMALAVVLDAIKAGEISDQTIFPVSEHAWRTGGAPAKVTTMFAKLKEKIAVSDLLQGLVVTYGNDAALVLAEGLSGSETAFTQRMNALARKIGMSASRFANPTGYPDPLARITLQDLSVLIRYLQTEHPDRYALFSQKEFAWSKIVQQNKSTFLRDIAGSNGLMLAYDEKAGFGAAVSILRGKTHILILCSGLSDAKTRDKAITDLVRSFGEFRTVELFPGDYRIGDIRVFGGATARVAVTGKGPIEITLPSGVKDDFTVALAYEGPVPAPIAKGQQVARLEIRGGDQLYDTVPLYAETDVPQGDLMSRARDGLMELLFAWW